MWWGRSSYISTVPIFPWKKIFWWDRSGKFKKKQEGKNVKNVGKKKKRSLHTWRFPYSCVLHQLRKHPRAMDPPSGECTHVGTSTTTFNAWNGKFGLSYPILVLTQRYFTMFRNPGNCGVFGFSHVVVSVSTRYFNRGYQLLLDLFFFFSFFFFF